MADLTSYFHSLTIVILLNLVHMVIDKIIILRFSPLLLETGLIKNSQRKSLAILIL